MVVVHLQDKKAKHKNYTKKVNINMWNIIYIFLIRPEGTLKYYLKKH